MREKSRAVGNHLSARRGARLTSLEICTAAKLLFAWLLLSAGLPVWAEGEAGASAAQQPNQEILRRLIAERCPEVLSQAQPKEETVTGQPRSISRPALQKEILVMEARDQAVRNDALAAMTRGPSTMEPVIARLSDIDATNLRRIKQIIRQDGFPTLDQVGVEGVKAAWLLVQHADTEPEFQAEMLKIVRRRFAQGEISGQEFALLTDRVRAAKGEPQLYGTQFEEHDGALSPKPIEDPSRVNERRKSLGMGTLESYACFLNAMRDAASPSKSESGQRTERSGTAE
jgi:hypothetical protein